MKCSNCGHCCSFCDRTFKYRMSISSNTAIESAIGIGIRLAITIPLYSEESKVSDPALKSEACGRW